MTITDARSHLLSVAALLWAPLSACSDPLADAENRYDAVVKSGASAAQVCAEGGKLASAYLDAGDRARYRDSQLKIRSECLNRQLDENTGTLRDDDGNPVTYSEGDFSSPNAM